MDRFCGLVWGHRESAIQRMSYDINEKPVLKSLLVIVVDHSERDVLHSPEAQATCTLASFGCDRPIVADDPNNPRTPQPPLSRTSRSHSLHRLQLHLRPRIIMPRPDKPPPDRAQHRRPIHQKRPIERRGVQARRRRPEREQHPDETVRDRDDRDWYARAAEPERAPGYVRGGRGQALVQHDGRADGEGRVEAGDGQAAEGVEGGFGAERNPASPLAPISGRRMIVGTLEPTAPSAR